MRASPICSAPSPLRRAAGNRLAGVVACVALAGACATPALAQPTASPPAAAAAQAPAGWFTVELPGTSDGLSRLIGHETAVEPTRLLLELVRLTQGAQLTQDQGIDVARRQLGAYLDAVDEVQDLFARFDPGGRGLTLKALSRLKRDDGRRVAASLGCELRDPAGALSAALAVDRLAGERRRLLGLAGVDAADLVARLNAGEAVRIVIPTVQVPLPLAPEVWLNRVLRQRVPASRLGAALLRDRSTALLAYGLAALDGETLAYVATSEKALEAARAFAPSFSACGRSLHVRGRRIQLPGGDAAAELWEPLVGAQASDPDRFIRRLLERDAGALASFYDMVDHLDPLHRQFVLAAAGTEADQRVARFRALYAACARAELVAKLPRRAFYRVSFDGGHLFRQLRLKEDGTLAPPATRRLWEEAFADSALRRVRLGLAPTVSQSRSGSAADAFLLADETLVVDPTIRRVRVETVLFAQRVFSRISEAQVSDAAAALRGFLQFPTLMLTLERIGIEDPALYAAAADSAARAGRSSSAEQAFIALAQLQGTIALIDRLTTRHSLSRAAAQTLVATLLPLTPPAEAAAGPQPVARWLQEHLLRSLPAPTADQAGETPAETRLLGGLAGPPVAGSEAELRASTIDWEGHRYRIDYATTELARLRKVRQKQGGNSLDVALALSSAASMLTAGGRTLDVARTVRAELDRLSKRLEPIFPGGPGGADGRDPDRAVADAVARLGGLAGPGDLTKVVEIGRGLGRAADAVLADALMSLVYATVLGDPDGLALLGGDPAALHDFGLDYALPDLRQTAPWAIAHEVAGGVPWHLAGTLLSLDLPLARLGLRRVSSDPPSGPPRVNPNDARTFAHTIALMDPSALRNADRDTIVQAIERGERRVAALARGEEPADALIADARLSEWRANLLRWTLAHEPDAARGAFSLTERFWLGRPALEPGALDAWGVSSVPLSGCLCLRFPPPEPWDDATGHPGDGQLATAVPDLTLRIAQMLQEQGLPAALVPGVLVAATSDVLDEARLAGNDDWLTLVRFIQSLGSERMEDYVAMLTAVGPLVPAPDKPGSGPVENQPGT